MFSSIKQYIDDKYREEYHVDYSNRFDERYVVRECYVEESMLSPMEVPLKKSNRRLIDIVRNMDESFSQMLLRLIYEKGMTDSENY